MWNRKTATTIFLAALVSVCLEFHSLAQVAPAQVQAAAQNSSSVSAEMVKGKLNPLSSKPGDKFEVRLKEDVRSNGEVLLKKGSTITGIVRGARQIDTKSKAATQSMLEIEWFSPEASSAANQKLLIALQSLNYTNPVFAQQQDEVSSLGANAIAPRIAPQSNGTASTRSGGLLGGVAGSTSSGISSTTSIAGAGSSTIGGLQSAGAGVTGTATAGASSTLGVAGQSGNSLVTSPSIRSADPTFESSLRDNFGVSGGPLYSMGHGEVVSANGTRDAVDIFSRLSNDTVITSPGRNFEIRAGARMQLLVGAKGR